MDIELPQRAIDRNDVELENDVKSATEKLDPSHILYMTLKLEPNRANDRNESAEPAQDCSRTDMFEPHLVNP
jgi:hypothetical protein